MEKERRFKPLWMIHNRTYRELKRGVSAKRRKNLFQKIRTMLKLKK